MNNDSVDNIKIEDKKAFKGFSITTIISVILGGILGFMSSNLKELLGENIPNLIISILEVITPFASIILSLVIIVVSKIVCINARKQYILCEESDDGDGIDRIEKNLSIVILLTYINTIIGYFFFGIALMLVLYNNINGDLSIIKLLCSFVGFIVCITSSTLIQKEIINFEKEINPLLKGSIYDKNFAKQWLDSCDESMKLGIYKSSYKAYESVSKTCIILWVFCIIGYDLWDFGIAPMFMVIIIWLVQTISYSIESIKYNKRK